MNKKTDKQETALELTGKQTRYLRGLGHGMEAKVIVGREGLSDNLLKSAKDTLLAHELIKVKLGPNCPLNKKEAAEQLAQKTSAAMVQLIGKTILLYRPNPELKKKEQIRIPSKKKE